jgi:hypothetical protein
MMAENLDENYPLNDKNLMNYLIFLRVLKNDTENYSINILCKLKDNDFDNKEQFAIAIFQKTEFVLGPFENVIN